MITKDRILAQIQHDSAAYDAFSDALKEVLIQEVALVRRPYNRNDRGANPPYVVYAASNAPG